jgi:purine-nucleoside phosphorylase
VSLAIIAGSGLGDLSRIIETCHTTHFADIPGVGAAAIAGHAGRIVTGAIDSEACQLVLGRKHFYEGDPRPIEHLIGHLVREGATTLLVTSAVGSLRRTLKTGELVVVRDIIDHQNRDARGDRRAQTPTLDGRLRVDPTATRRFETAATAAHVAWQPGVMFCASGPLYETPAEVEYQQCAGADVAAMSGAPEVSVANRLGLPVVAVAVVTNPCTGIDCAVPSHTEVLEASSRAARELALVVRQFVAG